MPYKQELSDNDFELFSSLIFKHSGICLNRTKKNLVKTRFVKRLKATGLSSFRDYYRYVTSNENGSREELVYMIDAISTNLTSFFRERAHFDFLKDTIIPELLQKKNKKGERKIRVWSAGCSTGEEPYTLAKTFCDVVEDIYAWDFKILATDISTRVLNIAQKGIYKQEVVEDIPSDLLKKHFQLGVGNMKGYYKVKDDLKEMVVFNRLNLMLTKYPFKGLFDLIFCRNVIIYFDKPTQEGLIERFYRYIQPGGYFFLGHSESLAGTESEFHFVKPAVYQKVAN